jgi:general secretion pathway protein J
VGGGIPRYLFTGTEDHLSFVTLEPPFPSAAGPYFVNYVVSPNGPEADLIRARAAYQQGMEAFPGATPANRVRLVEGTYRYHFAYADKSAGTGQWRNSWPYTDRLPEMIRLQIVDARRNAPVAQPLTVAVRADAELSCLGEKSKVCSAKSGGRLKASGESDSDDGNRKSKQ